MTTRVGRTTFSPPKEIEKLVRNEIGTALHRFLAADKTGKADYALRSAGRRAKLAIFILFVARLVSHAYERYIRPSFYGTMTRVAHS